MFEPSSRYANCEDAKLTIVKEEEEDVIVYKKRRFIPPGERMHLFQDIVVVVGGDRLDIIAARMLGDPEQFWRICDANDAMHPLDLTSEPGRILRIAVPLR
jgi:hypothetical protein